MTKVDIISGFLGAGKTTLIKKLIAEGYSGEKLVLIENEFGEIGIDGGFLQDAGVTVNEMNSGCICCSLTGDFRQALHLNFNLKGVAVNISNRKFKHTYAAVAVCKVIHIVFNLILQLKLCAVFYLIVYFKMINLVAFKLYHSFSPYQFCLRTISYSPPSGRK